MNCNFLTKKSLIAFLLFWCTHVFSQSQMGQDIDGDSAGDLAGSSVSMPDAFNIAISAVENDDNGSNSGQVKVYSWSGNDWVQKGADIDGESFDEKFGWSVSMPDSNTVAVGARYNSDNGYRHGYVRIHTWNGTAWVQKGTDINGEANGDWSGQSVSMPDPNTVAIGAPLNNGSGIDAGHVRVYSWNGSSWVKKGGDIDGETAYDESGWSVSMPDANTVAVGAKKNDGNGSNSGQVRIYEWDGFGWTQKGADIDGEAAGDYFGWSVSMPDLNTVAIGGLYNDGNGSESGHVRIYKWNGVNWIQKGGDIDGEAQGDNAGYSVSMPDSNTVAIGAHGNDGNGSNAGHVRVYKWNGNGWVQQGANIDGEASNDYAGRAVSMPEPNIVAFGAVMNDGNGTNSGHVRVYSLPPSLVSGYADSNGCVICDTLNIGQRFMMGADTMIVVNRAMLDSMLNVGADLSKACVSHVTNMKELFRNRGSFNDSIGNWDVSNVTTMNGMFFGANSFNQDIGNWDVSSVTDMSFMFYTTPVFNQDIGDWNVSNVTNMNSMLRFSYKFNQDISGWDVSKVTNMGFMLQGAHAFNYDISSWDVSGVTNMQYMFRDADAFNQDISIWDVSNVRNMSYMFYSADVFNQDIGVWDVSNVTNMNSMFFKANLFNQDIGNWDVSSVTDMGFMFYTTPVFNQDIGGWDVSNVTNMNSMFRFSYQFNQDIGNWDVSSVTNMGNMFQGAHKFNQDISNWDVGNVTNMSWMFRDAEAFNINIGDWDVSNVKSMSNMFYSADSFNEEIGDWDVSNVTNMSSMFFKANSFNKYIGGWNVSNVIDMSYMFYSAPAFNKDISNWDVSSVTNMQYMFRFSPSFNQDLSGWCVTNISSPPNFFAPALSVAYHPQWGTCLNTSTNPTTMAWTQLGVDIDGESTNDESGASVSMSDPYTVAIGARYNDGNGTDAGHVRIYRWNGTSWTQKGADIDGEAADDRFGVSVSMPDSNTVAVGAPGNDGNGASSGHVRIYRWTGSTWVQKGLDIDGEPTVVNGGANSGFCVSMPDSNTIAIGAPYSGGYSNDKGGVRIYRWDGSAWVQKGPDLKGSAAWDYFGWSVCMPDSNTVGIGAVENQVSFDTGYVQVYKWNGSTWEQKGAVINGEAFGDQFGYSISMPDSNTIAIGAPDNDGNGSLAGHVRVYRWDGNDWIQLGADIDGEAAGDFSGLSVSMPDTNIVAIGAHTNDGSAPNSGQVRIYRWNGIIWEQIGTDIDGEASGDRLGRSVSMPDANTVAIGAWQNDGNGTDAGHVRIYSLMPVPYLVSGYTDTNGCAICDTLSIGQQYLLGTDTMLVVDRTMLENIVYTKGDLTKVCVSHITDMKNVFQGAKWFNQDISTWDVSNVTTMRGMFFNAETFNQDISTWDVGAVTDMTQMFFRADSFNHDLNVWDVSQVEFFSRMFKEAGNFNGAVSNWDVSSAVRMSEMFRDAADFNKDLSGWCLSQFEYYNEPVNFETGSALTTEHMPHWGNCPNTYDHVTALATGAFVNAAGCVDCSTLNVGDYFELGGDTMLVVNRTMLDSLVDYRGDLSKVCVSHITDMTDALRGETWFNTDISGWDVSNVTNMSNMFRKAFFFNQNIGNWDVSNVTNMSRMFFLAKNFNGDISGWEVSSATRMNTMFKGAQAFNQNIGGWDVSSVFNMENMFRRATSFSQDLSGWCVSLIANKPVGFDANSGLNSSQLPNWGSCGSSSFVALTNMNGADDAAFESVNASGVMLYPNPTAGFVELTPVISGTYTLYNSQGQVIESGAIRSRYDLSALPNGVYIMYLETRNGSKFVKLLKK